MKNKVLHISHTDIRFDNRILKELKALESINDIQLLAYGIEGDEGNKYNSLSSDYIKTFTLVTKRAKFLSRALRYPLNIIEAFFKLTIPAIKYRPTIIHCHDTLFLPIALIIKLVTKAKLVYDAHELESNKSGQSKLLSRYSLFFEKITWKHINLLITVSDSIITWYNNKFGEKDSLLILNSPEIGKGTTSKGNYLREKFTIPIDKKIFLYLGIITKGRGIDLYLDVFKKK